MLLIMLISSYLSYLSDGEVYITVTTLPYKPQSVKEAIISRAEGQTRKDSFPSRGIVVGAVMDSSPRRRVASYIVMTILPKYKHDEDTILVNKRKAHILTWDSQTRIASLEVKLRKPQQITEKALIDTEQNAIFWSGEKWRDVPFVKDSKVYKVKNPCGDTQDNLLFGTPVYQSQKVVGLIWQVDDLYIRMISIL